MITPPPSYAPWFEIDSFYRMPQWNLSGAIFYDYVRLPRERVEEYAAQAVGALPCRVALLYNIGESPIGWTEDLENRGFIIEGMAWNPDHGKPRPPYDGIRHVIGMIGFAKAIAFSTSPSLCGIRFLANQPNIELANILRAIADQEGEEVELRQPNGPTAKTINLVKKLGY